MKIQYLLLSWNDYHIFAQKLAATMLHHSPKHDEIVAVSRGGLTLGHLLSDFLQLPISTFAIQSYTNLQTHTDAHIVQPLTSEIKGKRIFLVDDVADSGKTFVRALQYVKSLDPIAVTTVALFYKPMSIFRPDYYAKQTKKWIVFPYESTEMIKLITQNMKQDGKTKAQIQSFLTSLGFQEGQIAFVRKHHLNE